MTSACVAKALNKFRSKINVAAAESDASDYTARGMSDDTAILRAVTEARTELDGERIAIHNQVRSAYEAKQGTKKKLTKAKETSNAVQKQKPSEGVLRTEEPQVGLQEVGEGNAQPEGAAEKGKARQEEVSPEQEIAALQRRIADLEAKQEEDYSKSRDDIIQKLYTRLDAIEAKQKGLRETAAPDTEPESVGDFEDAALGRGDIRDRLGARTGPAISEDYPPENAAATDDKEVLAAVKSGGSLKDVLDVVAKLRPDLKEFLADFMNLTGFAGIKVEYKDEEGIGVNGNRIGGEYDPATNTVTIYRGGANAHTLAHEVVHGVTMHRLEEAQQLILSGRTDLTGAEATLVDNYARLDRLRAEAKAAAEKAGLDFYGLQDGPNAVMEFVAEAITNPDFKDFLQNQRSAESPTAPSLWHRFTSFLKALLNLKGEQAASILARVLDTVPVFVATRQQANYVATFTAENTIGLGTAPGLPTPAGLFIPRSTHAFTQMLERISDGDRDTKLAGFIHKAKDMLNTVIGWINTQRGYAAQHGTYAAIVDAISQMVREKESLLTEANEKLKLFFLSMRDPDLADMIKQMLAAGTQEITGKLPSDMAKNIADIVHEHMLALAGVPGKRKMYVQGEYGKLELAPHVRAMRVIRTKEDFVKGVKIPNQNVTVKFEANNPRFDEAMKGYESAMEGLILGHLQLLVGEETRVSRAQARALSKAKGKLSSAAYTEVEKLRQEYDKIFRSMSTIDVRHRRVTQLREENLTEDEKAKALKRRDELENFPSMLYGFINGKQNDEQRKATADFLGRTVEQLTQDTAGIRAELEKKGESGRLEYAKQVRDLVAGGIEFSKLNESEALTIAQALLTHYVPLRRFGKYTSRLRLIGPDGKEITGTVQLADEERTEKESKDVLDVWQWDDLKDLEKMVKEQNAMLGNAALVEVNVDGNKVMARLEWSRPEQTRRFKQLPGYIRPHELMQSLERIGIEVSVQDRAKIIKAATNADAAVRFRSLERRSVPGYSTDFVRAISDHLGSVASLVSIRNNKDIIDDLVTDDEGWKWTDKQEADRAAKEAEVAAETDPKRKDMLQKELDRLNANKAAIVKATEDRVNLADIRENARRLVDYVLGGEQLEEETNWITKMRAITTILQLGGTLASPITNLSSIPLHAFSYLATYSAERAYGGGFGGGAASGAIGRAAKALAPFALKSAGQITGKIVIPEEYFRDMEEKAKANGGEFGGYKVHHWEFLRKAAADGVLAAQRYNELLSQRKHSQFGPELSRRISQYMSLFAATEEYNRMVTGLASYELYYNRFTEGGMSETEAAEKAHAEATRAVYNTQGEYNMANRPRLFRNDIGSLVFLYKTFVVTTLELLRNLPPKGRAIFLGSLYVMAGASGLPLWEEIMTITDFITQKTGVGMSITKGNAERALAQFFRDMGEAHGIKSADEAAMRGLLDVVLGTEIFGRAGVKVGVPGLGLLRPGASVMDEIGRTMGAVGGAFEGTIKAGGKVMKGDLVGAARAAPVTLLKNFADAYTMAKMDAVMNKRGQVVIHDPSMWDIMARVAGFYPEEVMYANDLVRREEYTKALAKEIRTGMIEKYREASVAKDFGGKQEILQAVREHNQTFRGTALELLDFQKAAERAGEEAGLTLQQRAQKSLSKAQQRDTMLTD